MDSVIKDSNGINTPYINDPGIREQLWNSMSGELRYTLMNDFLAKYSLQKDLFALKGLIAALLHIDADSITDIQILNPIEPGEMISERDCILDIKLEINHDKIVNIEIQSRFQDFWPERSITYLCRNFDHLKEGQSFDEIHPCVQIGILDNGLFRKEDDRYTGDFFAEYRLLHTVRHTEYSSKFSIIVLSLNQLEKASEEEKTEPNGLYFWAKLLKATTWEELKMTASKNPMMESFVGTVKQLTAEEKVAQACERRRRFLQDQATFDKQAKEDKKRLAALNAQINEMDSEINRKEAEINRKEAEISKKSDEISRKEAEISKKNDEISRKEAEISKKNAEIGMKEAEISKKNAEIGMKEAEISKKNAEIGRQQEEIHEKDKQIEELKAQISKMKK